MKLCISILLLIFTAIDFMPQLNGITFGRDKLVVGGLLSGFFGGLSGNQGALRAAFLTKAGLSKEAFVATGTAVSTCIDLSRLGVYHQRLSNFAVEDHILLLGCAVLAAFSGAYLGTKLLKKITLKTVQRITALMLIGFAIALGAGWL